MTIKTTAASAAFVSAITVALLAGGQAPAPPGTVRPTVDPRVRAGLQRNGTARVIVELNVSSGAHVPEGLLPNAAAVAAQRAAIRAAQTRVIGKLPASATRSIRQFDTVPFLALEVNAAGLAAIEAASPDVARVLEDEVLHPVLAESVPLIEGDQVWQAGYDGAGMMVAVLDTGVDGTHPFLAGKVVEEACYSTNGSSSTSVCPNGQSTQIGTGSAVPCSLSDCLHGTHVAGIATGNGTTGGVPFSGVARAAQLMAVQVFTEINNPLTCGFGGSPCLGAYSSDIISGLERVYAVAPQYHIASVNMSLGGSLFSAPCDKEPYKPAVDNLRSIGIATVVAAGNSSSTSQLSSPGCISTVVSVGSTNKQDQVSWFSNVATFMSVFAPGESINSSVPGGGYQVLSGTSMATPHVAGTWAVIKQAVPNASVSTILTALQQTGLPVTDTRSGGSVTKPRIRIFEALATLTSVTNPAPVATALSPARMPAGSADFSLTVTGSGFDAFSKVQWNGVNRPTTVANVRTLRATISAGDVASVGTANITVFTPAPGGGFSASLPFTIDQPPVLTISAPTVAPGGSETMTLTNGYGNATDYLTLAAVGSPDSSSVQTTNVGAGVTSRTWTVAMPTTGGNYEFRLFINNARAATSPPVFVDSTLNPLPAITSLSPNHILGGGAAFTLTVNGSGFTSSSVVRWNGSGRTTTFVSGTQLQAAITASDIATSGTIPVTVFNPSPGGGTSGAAIFTIDQPPTLTVSATNVAGGAAVTVTLTAGYGGTYDWLALAQTSSPTTSYVQWTYVGAGVTSRTWTVNMPATAGDYEFRYFQNNSYVLTAKSPTVTVTAPPPSATTLTVSATSVAPGASVTVTLNGGLGGSTDWLALAATTAPNSTYLQWTYVGAGVTTRTWTVNMPSTAGTYEFRYFLNNGFTLAAKSPTVTVTGGGSTGATLTVNVTSVSPGGSVTATLTGGLGGAYDWLALAATTAPNTSYLQWTWVGAGVTTRTWTVNMPTTPGTYEFRYFPNNGYTLAAKSPPVTVK